MHELSDWWRGAVIYQIYPRSFKDTNSDGVGDLPGVSEKLDYVAGLGVDAIWLSPFFKSPMKDFGYDISDYRAVDPLFGTLEDFDRLLERAHSLGLKVLIDQVLNHTSDRHPWFTESRRSRDNARADWYVWADPKPDGTPPNNWLSVFGGPAWQWEPRRSQYYLHNFLREQPDLNFHNPDVAAQTLREIEFWLRRGVDGFRLDTVNFFFHDEMLRDNPRAAKPKMGGGTSSNPYAFQEHVYDKTRPENIAYLRQLRASLDRYPGTTMVGEIGDIDAVATMAEYTSGGDKLHMAYCFDFLTETYSAAHIRDICERLEARLGDGWPCWSFGNHDVVRVATRWGGSAPAAEFAKLLIALLTCLRGTACIYQGDELGLTQADVAFEQLKDPYGIEFWPEFKGRDGCRTPLPWTADEPYAGFSSAAPWLPIASAHSERAVDKQNAQSDSVLNACRTFLRWRAGQPALKEGEIAFRDGPDNVIVFERASSADRLLACFNLDSEPRSLSLAERVEPLQGHGFNAKYHDGHVTLPPYDAFFARIAH